MLRAAQITRQQGFSCFAVLDADNASSLKTYTAHRQVFYQGNAGPYSALDPRIDNFNTFKPERFVTVEKPATLFRPGATVLIKCFVGKPDKPFTIDAADKERSLEAKYKMAP